MNRKDQPAPTAAGPTVLDHDIVERLTEVLEAITRGQLSAAELELKCFTPAEAAVLLGKSENWVIEAIQDGRIPRTYVGKSPRILARHIREIQDSGEVKPHKYAKPAA
ncbi:helix-turn-helix domain-containing protein [Streptomyces phytophilus]|uniref:helix-turn-helix domain-containing protein n=1 Tax=Streptomyces phytophilus TaxID=722715 RepID=UPI0015F02059|nr:helix-turn-helix domain-containing protein [Streptomyces phytophilus]